MSLESVRGGPAEHALKSQRDASTRILHLRGRVRKAVREGAPPSRWLRKRGPGPKCFAEIGNQPTPNRLGRPAGARPVGCGANRPTLPYRLMIFVETIVPSMTNMRAIVGPRSSRG